jgi:uroporphyrinogen decarboxylase
MMTKRDNMISLFRRQGYTEVPVDVNLCPSLIELLRKETGAADYAEYFGLPFRNIADLNMFEHDSDRFKVYFKDQLKPGTIFDLWGVAHEPGSEAAKHMTRMRHPLMNIESLEQMMEYPFPKFNTNGEHQLKQVEDLHAKGLAAIGNMQMTIWETSWYMRSMEELMVDMMAEDPMAEYLLEKVTEIACIRAASFAKAGVDMLFLGDDIGMQRNIMMSETMYRVWLKPRIKKVIDASKKINPNLIVIYHSCGFIKPFINDLIEVGVDVLHPVQPECMDFKEIHAQFGDRLSFWGTIGTQTTMPFGSVDDVKREVYRNLEIAGDKGGLLCAPTHLLEPEVPLKNVFAYIEACRAFKS